MEAIEKIIIDKKVHSDLLDRYNEAYADYKQKRKRFLGFGGYADLEKEAKDLYYRLACETFDTFDGAPGVYELEEGFFELFRFFMKIKNWRFNFVEITEDTYNVIIQIE